jgi:UDP-2,3-diacylglucosamine hydrolase
MSRTIYLISDAHLGAGSPEQEARKLRMLAALFRRVADEKASLAVLGDLFDFWFEYRSVVQIEHLEAVRLLEDLRSRGCRISMVAGNHDFWLGDFIRRRLGIEVAMDRLVVEQDGRRVLLAHGDGLGPGDLGYKLLKAVLRFPANIWLYRLLHPDLGIPLAKWFSRISRDHFTKDRCLKGDPLWQAAREKFRQGFDAVVLGHVHLPSLRQEEGKTYCNLGDFITHFTYGRLRDGVLTLERMEEDTTT